jgi:protocatechuate 3,4-dioxygenase beta subunit
MFNTRIVPLLFAATLFTACPAAEGIPGTQGNAGNSGGNVDAGAGKNTISGQALDARGKPITGALIWVYPAATGGLVTAHTDAQGRYLVKSLSDRPYKVYAWAQPEPCTKSSSITTAHRRLRQGIQNSNPWASRALNGKRIHERPFNPS